MYKGFCLFRVYQKTVVLLVKEEICSKKREGGWIIKLPDMYCTEKKKMEKGTLKWVKVQQKGSKHNSLAMVTDNLNWWSIAIKLSALFLHLTFAVRIKLYLAARTAIVYDNNRISKAAPRRGVGLSTVYLIYFFIENIEFIFHLSLIELFSVIFIAANRGQRKCSLPPQLRSVFHGLWSSSSNVWP